MQENFELNHETLYLAVKLVDHYLVEVVSMRDKLQLIGSTAILIASKFEVTPCVLSWGAGAEGAVPLWSPWCWATALRAARMACLSLCYPFLSQGLRMQSWWAGSCLLVLLETWLLSALQRPPGHPSSTSCKQGLELEPRAGAV